ncbi:MAG: SDR family oxidoreductase [Sediminibacterium sp.]
MKAVITGASRGIGKSIAHHFAAAGYDLFLCSRGEVALYQTMEEIQTRYPDRQFYASPADLSQFSEATAFAEWVLKIGVPQILVNNAGQFIQGSIGEEPAGTLEQLMNINLFSAYHLTRALLPAMKAAGTGHIFNICSIASLKAYPHGGSYGISKYALAGFSANLREELKTEGIKVTGVFPGATMSPSWEGSGVSPDRIMQADDIARMIVAAAGLSPAAVVEDIILRPQLGDL